MSQPGAIQLPRSPSCTEDTARSNLLTQGGLGFDGLGVSAIVHQGAELLKGGAVAVAVGRCRGGLQGLLLGQVLQRFAEQTIDEDGVEEIFQVFSQDGEWVHQRFVQQNFEAWVALFSPGNLDIISSSPLLAVTHPGCVSLEVFGRISRIFYVKVNSDPEVEVACT